MPYLPYYKRHALDQVAYPTDAGDINYMISQIINKFIAYRGGLKYAVINEIVGALECAKLEMYRRLAAPYEDTKIDENGDVFTQ